MKIHLLYFAALRDAAGCAEETFTSAAVNARALYAELVARHGFRFAPECLRVAVNGAFTDWDCVLADGDEVAFLPPVSGG